MARKTKKRETMFEKGMEFTSVADAQATYNKADKKFKFTLICSAVSILATIAWALSSTAIYAHPVGMEICDAMMKVGLIAMFIGTNVNYFKYLFKAIKITWFIIPIFPLDLFFCLFGAAAFFIFSLFLPVVPCLFTLYQTYINKKEAETYLASAGGFCEAEPTEVCYAEAQ